MKMKLLLIGAFALLFSDTTLSQSHWSNSLKPNVTFDDSTQTHSINDALDLYKVNSVSIATIKEGEISDLISHTRHFQSSVEYLYQAGSISKPVAAVGVLVLVNKYDLNLDTSINTYLKSWQLKSYEFDVNEVTIRNLMSHTAGTSVHGFPGYKSIDKTPSIVDVLNGEGNTPPVKMIYPADSTWHYSGGGYEILHLLIEDVSGEGFTSFMQREVLEPFGMNSSTYELINTQDGDTCVKAYDYFGEVYKQGWNQYPESAAAGLWTTAEDLSRFLIKMYKIYNGEDGIITYDQVKEMFTPVKNNYGLGFGIEDNQNGIFVGHSGKNFGFTNDMVINLKTGNGVVVMTDSDGAFPLINEVMASCPGNDGWHVREQKYFETVSLSAEDYKSCEGKYTLTMRNGKKYKVEVVYKDNELLFYDKQRGITEVLIPVKTLSGLNFVVERDGSEISFGFESEGSENWTMSWGEETIFIKK